MRGGGGPLSELKNTIYIYIYIFYGRKRWRSCPKEGVGGGGNLGNAWKKTFFFTWGVPLPSLRRVAPCRLGPLPPKNRWKIVQRLALSSALKSGWKLINVLKLIKMDRPQRRCPHSWPLDFSTLLVGVVLHRPTFQMIKLARPFCLQLDGVMHPRKRHSHFPC